MHGDYIDYSNMGITRSRENLVKYYHDRLEEDSPRSELQDYARAMFIMPFETALIESLLR